MELEQTARLETSRLSSSEAYAYLGVDSEYKRVISYRLPRAMMMQVSHNQYERLHSD